MWRVAKGILCDEKDMTEMGPGKRKSEVPLNREGTFVIFLCRIFVTFPTAATRVCTLRFFLRLLVGSRPLPNVQSRKNTHRGMLQSNDVLRSYIAYSPCHFIIYLENFNCVCTFLEFPIAHMVMYLGDHPLLLVEPGISVRSTMSEGDRIDRVLTYYVQQNKQRYTTQAGGELALSTPRRLSCSARQVCWHKP